MNKTLALLWLALLAWVAYGLLRWGLWHAVWAPNLAECTAWQGQGACWGVVAEKGRVMLLGRYPPAEQWRAIAVVVLWTGWVFAALLGWLHGRWLWCSGAALPAVLLWFMHGGAGLPVVSSTLWGGLPLTLLISGVGFAGAFPLAVGLALGRRSRFRAIRWACTVYIEVLRALPLVSVLFLAAFVLPKLVSGSSVEPDLFARVTFTIALFSAAYLAEVVRGGLQAVPRHQAESAQALGLSAWQVQWLVVLPQALRVAMPGVVNSFVTLFKECSLVSIVALFELTGALGLALSGDLHWRAFYLEGYVFIAFIYWAYCFGLSKAVEYRQQQGR
ncbi:amino acid ABC transporter permease [Limnobacter humi]|uniref:Amino acid ABC transporter permease n=1 Tax=Limnobacter humi TaxID=1778671 RepID=A0ABT1WDW4_9BURK|nr:amino acid ABC transporter permease [Limnobacter humi]MCQ8895685.1 amino acid ABC transporter permease [Limnobacter humi]